MCVCVCVGMGGVRGAVAYSEQNYFYAQSVEILKNSLWYYFQSIASKIGATLKGNNLLPLGANYFLLGANSFL